MPVPLWLFRSKNVVIVADIVAYGHTLCVVNRSGTFHDVLLQDTSSKTDALTNNGDKGTRGCRRDEKFFDRVYETLLSASAPDLSALHFVTLVVLKKTHRVIEQTFHGCTFCFVCRRRLAEEYRKGGAAGFVRLLVKPM